MRPKLVKVAYTARYLYNAAKVVCDRRHVEPAVGFGAAAMTALIDGDDRVSQLCKMSSDAIPQAGVRGETVDEHERCCLRRGVSAPKDAVQVEVPTHGDHFTARCNHPMSFARHGMNGTMEAQ